MRLTAAFLPSLAAAGAVLPVRQSGAARFTSISYEGQACPPNTGATAISSDGSIVNVIFSEYRAEYQAGTTPPGQRDLACDMIFTIEFPLGCTALSIETRHHGYSQITQGGVRGDVEPSYILSGGQLSGVNTSPTRFDTRVNPDFVREDLPTAAVTIRNANERSVRFQARTRMRVITDSDQVAGVVWLDAVDVALTNQRAC